MLEHVPAWLGRALGNVRAGHGKLAMARLGGEPTFGAQGFALSSPAFSDGAPIPARFTADADAPISPPLAWTAPPASTRALALVVEDPDAPGMEPFVHWLGWGFPAGAGSLGEGEAPPVAGRNSYQQSEWLPPDPPTGHGPHDYVFQLFALDGPLDLEAGTGRGAVVDAIEGRVLAAAVLRGTYERRG